MVSSEPRVAFLARDLVWGDVSGGSLPFSYAARKLEASVRSAPDLGHVETCAIDLREDDPEAYFEAIRAFGPSVVAASAYIWSIGLFCRVAELVKKHDPEVRVVMGGPAARPSVLALSPYAPYARFFDAIATGEGEEVIRAIVREHGNDDWRERVAGLHVPHALGFRASGEAARPALDDYASPYQLGTIPRAEHGFLETFRGCPISCAFCQWGDARADRVYSAEYLAEHLRGFDAAGVERVHVLDAAFNLSPRAFRNFAAAEREVRALGTRQVLGHVYPTYLKDEHLDLFDTFGRVELAVGIQSFDGAVLKGLGRPFDAARFARVLDELSGRYPIDLELILGLPGDDPASFRRTFERALSIPATVRVFYCLALPDALLERAEEFDLVFDPETFAIESCLGWSREDLENEWAYVREIAGQMHRPNFGRDWVDFRTDGAAERSRSLGDLALARLRRAVASTQMGYRLRDARADGGRLILDLDAGEGGVVLEARVATPGQALFAEHDGIAYSHRGELEAGGASRLRSFIAALHQDVGPVVAPLGGDGV